MPVAWHRIHARRRQITGDEKRGAVTALVLMGVSGAGKTTIGRLLAADLGCAFVDADDLHPEANRRKMASGCALDDDDRRPWLRRVRRSIEDRLLQSETVVVACSALKRSYRDTLTCGLEDVRLVYLRGTPELIAARLERRDGHFMPPELLASQLQTLEEPTADARGAGTTWIVDVGGRPEAIVAEIRAWIAESDEE